MLNPVLIDKYGEECREFYEMLIERTSEDDIDKCYVADDMKVPCGLSWVPGSIYVYDDVELKHRLTGIIIRICWDLEHKYDVVNDNIVWVFSEPKDSTREVDKLWVGKFSKVKGQTKRGIKNYLYVRS